MPLAAYLEAFETTDEGERAARPPRTRQVRDHATKLAAKAYWRQFTPAPDFVVMFVPDETLPGSRTSTTGPWARTRAQGVVLASPSTLMTLLRTVAAVWQQETVAWSAREGVHELGAELHKRLGTFAGHLAKVGRSLDGAVGAFNEAVGSFEPRVLVQARRLGDHGVAGTLTRRRRSSGEGTLIGAGDAEDAAPSRQPSSSCHATPMRPDAACAREQPGSAFRSYTDGL